MLSSRLALIQRRLSSQIAASNEHFRTSETSPSHQNVQQIGHFYKLDPEICKTLFSSGGLPKSYSIQTKTFAETTIMVRKPALDVINCIRNSDMSKPAIRYVLYGERGTGKSLTMAHLIHYAFENKYIIVHVPWVSEWLRRILRHKEMSNSATHDGMVDIPLDAAAWLVHFKSQNQALLKELNLTVSKEYEWSKRENTPAGSTLIQLADHGINRVKYATNVITALLQELKDQSSQKKCKTFVAVDGFNCFFYPTTRIRTSTKKNVPPSEVTLTHPFLDITKNDWNNGAIVLTADELAVPEDHQESYLPRYLLKHKGFEHLDPFVPVKVDRYNDKEFETCTAYYRNRLWLRGPAELEAELKLASVCNPFRLMQMCAPL